MDRNILKAKWKQIRGRSKILRVRLTDNARGRVVGKVDVLVGGIQEQYHITRSKATRGASKRASHYQNRIKKLRPVSKLRK
jgi:uncharacterized protein YjbJ (UPF0337 family)